jgi:hypothetical protein
MPAMLRIDTLKFARSLAEAGMDRRQAEALVQGLSEADASDFATKADVGEVRTEVAGLRADMADLRAELRTEAAELRTEVADLRTELKGEIAELRAETRTEFAAVRAEMADLKAEMFRFMYLQAMGIVGLTVGLTVTLIKLLP